MSLKPPFTSDVFAVVPENVQTDDMHTQTLKILQKFLPSFAAQIENANFASSHGDFDRSNLSEMQLARYVAAEKLVSVENLTKRQFDNLRREQEKPFVEKALSELNSRFFNQVEGKGYLTDVNFNNRPTAVQRTLRLADMLDQDNVKALKNRNEKTYYDFLYDIHVMNTQKLDLLNETLQGAVDRLNKPVLVPVPTISAPQPVNRVEMPEELKEHMIRVKNQRGQKKILIGRRHVSSPSPELLEKHGLVASQRMVAQSENVSQTSMPEKRVNWRDAAFLGAAAAFVLAVMPLNLTQNMFDNNGIQTASAAIPFTVAATPEPQVSDVAPVVMSAINVSLAGNMSATVRDNCADYDALAGQLRELRACQAMESPKIEPQMVAFETPQNITVPKPQVSFAQEALPNIDMTPPIPPSERLLSGNFIMEKMPEIFAAYYAEKGLDMPIAVQKQLDKIAYGLDNNIPGHAEMGAFDAMKAMVADIGGEALPFAKKVVKTIEASPTQNAKAVHLASGAKKYYQSPAFNA